MEDMVKPMDWVEDLLAWERPEEPSSNLCLTNYKRDKLAKNEREILVCHDMQGGYLEQERDNGYLVPVDSNPYVFLNWWNIDIFCYFSHHFLTIPPSGYINTAHKHGCLVMGTLITEWTPGVEKCEKMFESEQVMEQAVLKMVDIAEYHRFDGWLINIENSLKDHQLPTLCNFLHLLTTMMRSRLGTSRVIWYDSVIETGQLIWQNELNFLNKSFYDCCDGIYLNYNWTDEMLLNSADFGLLNRIYIGIDVFGRGCIGGWDCHKPFSRSSLLKMSLALFAPGWVTEKFPQKDPIEINLKFWRKVHPFTISRPIVELPIETTFSAGFSETKEGKRFRLNNISIQPHYERNGFQSLPGGGLFISQEGSYRIFRCDLEEKSITVELSSSVPVTLQLNDSDIPLIRQNGNCYSGTACLALKSVAITTSQRDTIIESVHIY